MSENARADGEHGVGVGDELDAFSTPLGTSMRRVPDAERVEFSEATKAVLLDRLDQFDSVRNRGAVEVRAW